VAIVGAGRIGLSLAADLSQAGPSVSVSVVGRSTQAPPFLDGLRGVTYQTLGGATATELLCSMPLPEVLVFAVPDDSLAAVAREWVEAMSTTRRRRRKARHPELALHTSGLHAAEVLAPLRALGTDVASWHPLVAVARPRRGAFQGISVGIEGDAAAVDRAAELARQVGARSVRVRPDRKALYHTAAVFGSNYVVACLSVALRQLKESCVDEVRLPDLLPLARSAVENLVGTELAEGATGPLVRGDEGTVASHLAALDPAARSLYRALAGELLDAAGDRLSPATHERIARMLEAGAAADEERGEV
jgi:predicted short-subunit dehydrogenase-like oxidoreductase (DUF2520 family)